MQSIVTDTNLDGGTEGMQRETDSEMDCTLHGGSTFGRQFFGTDDC